MSGPWERYQGATPAVSATAQQGAPEGPWTRFQPPAPAPLPKGPQGARRAPPPAPESPLAVGADLLATGLSGATVGTVGTGLVGIGSRLMGRNADKDKADFNEWAVWHPQTRGGREAIQKAEDFMSPVTGTVARGVNAADRAIGKVVGPTAQQYVREFFKAGQDVAGAVPAAGAAAQGVKLGREVAGQTKMLSKVAKAPDDVARAAGLRVAPGSVADATGARAKPGMTARAADAIAGQDTNLINQRHNKLQVNNIAMQDIGLAPNTPVSKDALAKARKPHAETYDQIRKVVPTTPVDQAYETAVLSVGKGSSSVLEAPKSIESLRQQILQPMDGGQMIDTISDLRVNGWKKFLAKDNPEMNAEGSAMLDMANAIEQHLDRTVARVAPDLEGKYQIARRGFAKVDAVEASIVGNDVDPQALVRMASRSDALDGGLKVVADTATHFPRDFNIRPARMNDTGSLSLSSLVSPIRHGAGWGVSRTRGEARAPRLGMEGPLSYYYRTYGDSGVPKRGPMSDPRNLLANPSEMAINRPNEGLNPGDVSRGPYGHPGEASTSVSPPLALPAPGRTSYGNPNAAAAGEMGLGPDIAAAGARHPGGTPLAGHPPQMELADSLEAYIAKQRGDGINFENVLIEPTKRRTYPTVAGKRQRGIKQGERVGNRENVRAEPGARERGMALELALQGKKVPKDKKTYRARTIDKEKP